MGLLILIISVMVGLVVTVSGQQCGTTSVTMRPNPTPIGKNRIVRGVEAKPHSHPWIASIQGSYSGFNMCGASLIRVGQQNQSDILITAAHCLGSSANNMRIVLSAHDLTRPDETQQSIPVEKFIKHPKNVQPYYDIAIIKLVKPVQFTPTIQPVCLPVEGEQIAVGIETTAAGWGSTGGRASNVLMQVGLTTVKGCQYRGNTNWDTTAMFCTATLGGQDICFGDSGGPLVVKKGKGYVLQGLPCGVSDVCGSAGGNSFFTRISFFIPWINEQIKALNAVTGAAGGAGEACGCDTKRG